jgi:SepF-like predicted cell division protein (DUF552 family)
MFNVGDKVVYISSVYKFPDVIRSIVSGEVVIVDTEVLPVLYSVHFTEVRQALWCYVEELQLEQPTEE